MPATCLIQNRLQRQGAPIAFPAAAIFSDGIMERGQDIAHQPESVKHGFVRHASPALPCACAPSSID